MTITADMKPVITVLTAPDEALPPGLSEATAEATLRHACDTESLRQALADSDVLCVTDFRTGTLDAAFSAAQRLSWIHATSAGVDSILIPAVRASTVPVTNARGIFDAAIAEYVLGQIIAFSKDFLGNLLHQQRHEWRHRDTERVAGRRVLVVGAGSIGHRIGALCHAVGMTCDGVARSERDGGEVFGHIHAQSELRERLPDYDFVVVAAPLTEQTRGLFDHAAFAAMASHARFINIGRGPIVRTDDLIEALRTGSIAGAALDVFEQEPLPADHPLWDLPNVRLSAHMAGDFIGWREALSEQFLDNLRRWRHGEPLLNRVDEPPG